MLKSRQLESTYLLPVISTLASPPGSPAIFDRYLISSSPGGIWTTHANKIAEWNGNNWEYLPPAAGYELFNAGSNSKWLYYGGVWVEQVSATAAEFSPIGTIIEYNFRDYSSNWKPAIATAISRATYSTLWSKISRTISSLDDVNDKVNSTAHGLQNNDLVKFDINTGGITAGTNYYVINKTNDDFQISLTKSGSAINLTASASGTMIINVEYGFGDGSTTFNLPDRRGIFARGAESHGILTKATGNPYDGGVIGSIINDRFQGFLMGVVSGTTGTNGDAILKMNSQNEGTSGNPNDNSRALFAGTSLYSGNPSLYPMSNGVNGTPRTSDETNPISVAVQFIVKVL